MKTKMYLRSAVALAAVASLSLSSCGKYEDGPGFSLRTKTARLTGEWEVSKMAGQDVLSILGDITMEFEKEGDFTMTFSSAGYSASQEGDWEWIDSKEAIEIDMDGEKTEFEVKRLTNSEFWFEDEDNIEYELDKI